MLSHIECEKKLNESMADVLENKISELIAENATLKLKNIQLDKYQTTSVDEMKILKEHIKRISSELETSAKDNHHF